MDKKAVVEEVLFHLKDFRKQTERRASKIYDNITRNKSYDDPDDVVWQIYDLISNR